MRRALRIDFVRFCLVGATGFIINFALLTLLYKLLGWPVFVAQLLASEVSLFSNFILHNQWTYKRNHVTKTIPQLLVQFHASSWAAILGSSLIVSILVDAIKIDYVIALIISSGVALLWNFSWTKFFIWRSETRPQLTGEEES
jgi:putative flippase GtrA